MESSASDSQLFSPASVSAPLILDWFRGELESSCAVGRSHKNLDPVTVDSWRSASEVAVEKCARWIEPNGAASGAIGISGPGKEKSLSPAELCCDHDLQMGKSTIVKADARGGSTVYQRSHEQTSTAPIYCMFAVTEHFATRPSKCLCPAASHLASKLRQAARLVEAIQARGDKVNYLIIDRAYPIELIDEFARSVSADLHAGGVDTDCPRVGQPAVTDDADTSTG
jgi:hypothetical protein